MIILNKTTKSETKQDKVSFQSPSLLLSTSITTLLLVLLALSTITISITRTTTSDVSMYLPSFIVDTPDVKKSDLKIYQLTIQSRLSFIKVKDPKIQDRYKNFWSSFTTIPCKNLRLNLQLTGYNIWKHRWKHIQYEHTIPLLHCSQHYLEFHQYQQLITASITYATSTLDIYHDTFILQLDGSSDIDITKSFKTLTSLPSIISTVCNQQIYYYENHKDNCTKLMKKSYESYSNNDPIEATDCDTSRLTTNRHKKICLCYSVNEKNSISLPEGDNLYNRD